jgi:O-antigen/teichoic acid export membrane protein
VRLSTPTASDPLKSILRNSSLLIGAQGLSSAIGLILLALLPRFLGDAEFGRLHLALSMTMMLGVAVEFGLTQVLTRAVARDSRLARPYLVSATRIIIALGATLYVALLVGLRLLGYHVGILELASILGLVMVAEAMAQALSAIFQAHERMLTPAVARVTANLFTLAVAAPLLAHGHGAFAIATVMVIAALVRVAIMAATVGRLHGFASPRPVQAAGFDLLAAGLPFLVWQALGIFYFRMDVVMLGWLTTDATVGWYGVASRLTDSLTFVPQIVTTATFPVAARLWVSAPDEFRAIVRKTLQVLLVVTVPASVGLLTLAREVIDMLFTLEAFGPAVPILRIHSLTLGLLFVDFFLVGVLMAIGRERSWIAIAGGACLVSPLMARSLIPLADSAFGNGGIGAALGTCLTEAFIMICALRLFPAGTLGAETWLVAARAVGAGVVMAFIVLLGRAFHLPWVLAGIVGGLAYLGLVIRLGLLPAEALHWVTALVARRTPAKVV